nr:polysaccharide deacetylase family protein [Ochrobactrum sp. UNC390CL2Tsu3S39]
MIPIFPWPDGKRCAVAVTVLFDDGLDAIARAPDLAERAKSFSVWEYGAARGVDCLCALFDDFGVNTTWFIPGDVAMKHRDAVTEVARAGHEIAARGVAFEDFSTLNTDAQKNVLLRSADILAEITGRRPNGFRLPRGLWPRHFDQILKETGFYWSASLNGDDAPYIHPSSLVELPVHVELEDRPYFQFNFAPAFPKGLGRIASYDGVLHNWKAEFDAYRQYGRCYVLQVRPEMIGTPGRIFILEQLLQHILQHDDVWLATGGEIAAWTAEQAGPLETQHPLNIFEHYRKEQGRD